eukprot:CAMPEP_0172440932 /NCGR_PEP_ID=MMETSP1065-20121228/1548_1 /TAXON_ID=265537 /ORGANISM="Amphiprora paludosa, Strain CCMP125" /LENGTH=199 /DNA_ID=CAMNT_0013190053 /DNA_START=147 /DNA_END=746 /DNA_ORIENTATION=+
MGDSNDDERTNNRRRPNVLVTGTPGVGKTSTASMIAERLGMKHFCVGDLVREHSCVEGRDESLETNILDEDKLLDAMEPMIQDAEEEGVGCVVDFHVCEIFPERWFDLVLVLRTDTEILYDRLTSRGYSDHKRSENMESEIMQVILEEAREAYDRNIVHEVRSNTVEEMEANVQRVEQWVAQWMQDNNVTEDDNNIDNE